MIFSRAMAAISVVGLLGTLATAAYYKFEEKLTEQRLVAATAQNSLWKGVHDQDVKALKQLAEFRAADEKAQATVAKQIAQINLKFGVSNAAIERLRRENVDIAKYLRECVPGPLRDVLNGVSDNTGSAANRKDGNDKSNAAKKPSGTLRPVPSPNCQ